MTIFWVFLGIVIVYLFFGTVKEGFDSTQTFAKPSVPNCPSGATAQSDGTCIGECPSGSTKVILSNGAIQCKKSTSSGGFSQGPAPVVPATSCQNNGILFSGGCYQQCPSGQTLQNVPRMGVMCVSSSSTPSSSNVPCSPAFRSIPGGAMETKCFS
jgi:hypothetical protein